MAAPAPDEIQIFVKPPEGKTVTLDVVPAIDTVDAVKRRLLEKIGLKDDFLPRFGLVYKSKPLRDEIRLSEYGIMPASTLSSVPRMVSADLYDDAVLDVLRKHLQELQGAKGAGKLFTFIGIGSYDHAHGTESIKRQQCPDPLLAWCNKHGWQLKVMLIDRGFVAKSGEMPQIYDQADQGWIAEPRTQELDGKIRCFDNRDGKHQVTTYATGVPEYGRLRETGTIGGFDVNALRADWSSRSDRCLVAGNFYDPSSQDYVTLGDVKVVTACGFKPQ